MDERVPLFSLDKNSSTILRGIAILSVLLAGFITRQELAARHEIYMENYSHVLHIEAMTMIDAGADRIGASAGIAILSGLEEA